HERHSGQGLLAAREQMNGAVLLAGRPRHHGNARGELVLAHELEIGVSAAKEPWELLAQAGVDALEGVLEARARLAIDTPHRFGEGIERRGEIGELAIEVLLALALVAQLIDRGEIDRTEPLGVGAGLGELLLPGKNIRIRGELRLHLAE